MKGTVISDRDLLLGLGFSIDDLEDFKRDFSSMVEHKLIEESKFFDRFRIVVRETNSEFGANLFYYIMYSEFIEVLISKYNLDEYRFIMELNCGCSELVYRVSDNNYEQVDNLTWKELDELFKK